MFHRGGPCGRGGPGFGGRGFGPPRAEIRGGGRGFMPHVRGRGGPVRGGPGGPMHGAPPPFLPQSRGQGFGGENFKESPHFRGGHRGRGHHRGRGAHPGHVMKNKKEKVDKRDLAENNAYYCDVCDRGYKQQDKYIEHVEQHTKCHVEGCTYIASPKLVKLHYETQHRTGLAKKIWSLESDEDIKKWREERKKNFPTAANVMKKKVSKEAQNKRGEVLQNKQFGKMGRGGRQHGRGGMRGKFGQFGQKRHGHFLDLNEGGRSNDNEEPQEKKAKYQVSEVKKPKTPPRDPTLDPLSYVLEGGKNSDEEKPQETPAKPLKLGGGLGSLIASYGDVTDSEEEDETPVIPEPPPKQTNIEKQKETAKTDEESSVQVETQQVPTKPATEEKSFPPPKPYQKRPFRRPQPQWKKTKMPTLLEKLLAPEIRHERNVILQCVRYIVNNNFFGIGQKKELADNSSSDVKSSNTEETPSVNCDRETAECETVRTIDEDVWERDGENVL